MSDSSSSPVVADDFLWRTRWLLAASISVGSAAAGWLVLMHHDDWRWPLFLWGVAMGLAGAAILPIFLVLLRQQASSDDQRVMLRRRMIVLLFGWLFGGSFFGAMSAAFNQPWLDLGLTMYVVATLLVDLAFLMRRLRRS